MANNVTVIICILMQALEEFLALNIQKFKNLLFNN